MSYVEQSGDTPLRSVVLYNMGELAAATGRLEEAERFYREGLALAAQIKDREYLSTWSSILGMVLIRQRRFKDAAEVILQALSIGRAEPPNQPCIGFALAALANLRSALVENERAERTPAGRRALLHARKHLQRALDLGELDAERRTMAQLFQARVSYMLGELPLARLQCEQARQAAHAYELQAIEGLSQELQTVLASA
jgi:tetratricopeptide (TPR) repeat protein